MEKLSRSDTVTKAIAAAQEEATTIPLREDDNDDETIHGLIVDTHPTIDTSIFDVFTDFDLDLTCLSRPGSPVASTSELPPSTPSPPASPPSSPPLLSRSISYASQLGPLTTSSTTKKASKKPSQQLSSTAPASSRGSWPLVKYAGRGTPIDRNRRLEWGGFFSSESEVAEDGVLFSTVRSTSLDSAIRPSQRSISPEWTYTSPLSSSLSHSSHSEHHSSVSSHVHASVHEPPPEIAPIQGLGLNKSDEWDSIMKTVLSSSTDLSTPDKPSGTSDSVENDNDHRKSESRTEVGGTSGNLISGADVVKLSPEQMEQLNNGLEMDLGINQALDLGLGQHGGMNWFSLGLLPASGTSTRASGRESPSVYSSQAATPRASIHESEHASEHRSTTSTKAGAVNAEAPDGPKSETPKWWQKMLLRIRRVHTIITIHKNRF